MVSKVTLSILVLCLCLSETLQSPDHNRTRRADDKPGFPAPSIEDMQGFMNVFSNLFSSFGIPNKGKDKNQKSDHEEDHKEEHKD